MEVIKIDPERIDKKKINYIVDYLKRGKVVVLPTDTSYGMAVNALDSKAINKIYRIKDRDKKKPLSIIVKNIAQAKKYSVIDKRTKKLFNKFLPGRLTIIAQKKEKLPTILLAGGNSVGLRMPKSKIIEKVMEKIDFPISATSANISGEKDSYSAEAIFRQYKKKKNKPDLVVDIGILSKNRSSTIIDLSDKKIKLIRSGPIKYKDVVNYLKN